MSDSERTAPSEAVAVVDRAGEQGPRMLEKILAAAQPGAVYGQPAVAGAYTLITAAEVTSGGGFGVGLGIGTVKRGNTTTGPAADAAQPAEPRSAGGGAGFGGGGGAAARPVAVIAVGPEGVTIRPVVDVTKIGLTALTTAAAVLGALRALRRAGKG